MSCGTGEHIVSCDNCGTGECIISIVRTRWRLQPGGGTVVYDAGEVKWWGRYLEALPLTKGRGLPWSLKTAESVYVGENILRQGIGWGRENTTAIVAQNGEGRYAAKFIDDFSANGKSDWFLPSRDELDAVYNTSVIAGRPKVSPMPYWTSSENSAKYAWYLLFQDGTQFTDENKVGQSNGNKQLRKSQVHTGSSFPSLPFHLVAMRSFPVGTGVKPSASSVTMTGNSCTSAGPCAVGDVGPAGGIIFHDAGPRSAGDRYFEVGSVETEVAGIPWKPLASNDVKTPLYVGTGNVSAKVQRVLAKAFGMGEANTSQIMQRYRGGNYPARFASTLVFGGFDDWYLPSKEELRLVYRTLGTATPRVGNFGKSFYWTSSEYDLSNAWTVNFKDGQEFDREKWRVPDPATGMKAIRTRPIRSFG
ncbi:MAG: DUF1566 domain-containing protein [Actinobacteria bacterium]|nr:DUF1566 domain-containing protein [Actinomycetota bacterium]